MPTPDSTEGRFRPPGKERKPWTQQEIQLDLLSQIKGGRFRPGDPFPTSNALFHLYGANVAVLARAVAPFRRAGVVTVGTSTVEGRFVSARVLEPDVLEDIEEEILMQRNTRLGVTSGQQTREDKTPQGIIPGIDREARLRRADSIIHRMLNEITEADPQVRERIEAAANAKAAIFAEKEKSAATETIQAETPKERSFLFTPGEIPQTVGEGIHYVREMLQRIDIPTFLLKYQDLVPVIVRDLQAEGFPRKTVESLVGVISAFLATETNYPITMVATTAQAVIDDAITLRNNGIDEDVLTMALHQPASFYIGTPEETVQRPPKTRKTISLGDAAKKEKVVKEAHDEHSDAIKQPAAQVTAAATAEPVIEPAVNAKPTGVASTAEPVLATEEIAVMLEGKTDRAVEVEHPPLDLKTMARLSAGVGNSEAKAGLYPKMEAGIGNTTNQLYHMIRDDQVGEAWVDIGGAVPAHWCSDSLYSLGLVGIIAGPKGEQLFFRPKSELGNLAEAWAGRSMKFSEDHPEISLSQLQAARLTDPNAPKESMSGTLLRIRLLQELAVVENGVIAQKNLAEALFGKDHDPSVVPSILRRHLQSLSDAGLITLESNERGKSYAEFSVNQELPTEDHLPSSRPTLTKRIITVITPQGADGLVACPSPFTRESLHKALCEQFPDVRRLTNIPSVYRKISEVVSNLIKAGFVQSVGLRQNERKRIHVPEDSQILFAEYTALIEEFRNEVRKKDSTYLEESIALARSIAGDPERFSRLLAKAKSNSPFTGEPLADTVATAYASHDEVSSAVQTLSKSSTTTIQKTGPFNALTEPQDTTGVIPPTAEDAIIDVAVNTAAEAAELGSQKAVIGELQYIQYTKEWADAVYKRGEVPHQRTRSFLRTVPDQIAKALRINPFHLVNETRRTRGVTSAGARSPHVYDMTQTFIPLLWLNQLTTSEGNLPVQAHAFADPDKTREKTIKRKPEPATAQRYGIDEDTDLVTHITRYYDEQGRPFAIKIHTIPESRAPQEYLDALAA